MFFKRVRCRSLFRFLYSNPYLGVPLDESKKGILAFFQDLNEDIFTAYAEFLEGSLDSIGR